MSGRYTAEDGYTLIELLIGIIISGIILTALGTAFILAIRGTGGIEQRASDSHDAQQVSAYLPADVQSASGTLPDIAAGTASGCSGTDPGINVIRFQWTQDTTDDNNVHTTTTYYASYRYDATNQWLIRLYCASGQAPDQTTVAHSLASYSTPQICGDRVSINFQATNGYVYTVSGAPRTNFGGPPACPPSVGILQMLDADLDGKVDRVVATFDTSLTPGLPCTLGWSIANGPSGATLNSVSVSGPTATLNLNEGGGPPDTSVGTFTVAYTGGAGCNAAGFPATAPADRAAPVITALTTTNGNGMIQPADTMVLTFSEPVTGVPASTSIIETEATPDTLSITGISNGAVPMGNGYVKSNKSVTFAGTVVVASKVVTITVGSCTATCGNELAGSGVLSFNPATSVFDSAGNTAQGTFTTASSFKTF